MTFRERLVLIDFSLLALLWITRDPKVVPGWDAFFRPKYVTDGTTAALLALVLFVLPDEPPEILSSMARCVGRCAWLACGREKQQLEISMVEIGGRLEISIADWAPLASASPPGETTGSLPPTTAPADSSAIPPTTAPADSSASPPTTAPADSAAISPTTAPADSSASPPPSPSGSVQLADDGEGAGAPRASGFVRVRQGSSGAGAPRASPAVSRPLLEWDMVQKTLPWDVVLLLGGGFALADAVLVSGLNALLGESLSVLHDLPANVVALLLMILVSVTTSVASNVATASIFVPVVAGLADSMGIHPLLFMLSATLTSSLAFVLPVSTPPNAIAFSSGRLAVMDMIKVGTCLNVLGVLAVLLVLDTFGIALYGPWEEQPAWARRAGSSPPPPLRSNVTNLACTP